MRDLLELIALNDVAHLIFVEIAELDAAFQAGANFLHIVCKASQRRKPAIINRLEARGATKNLIL